MRENEESSGSLTKECLCSSLTIRHKGTSSREAMESAIYLLSTVLRAILFCYLLAQWIKHPQAKSVLTYMSSLKVFCSCSVRPLFLVARR
jgi:hypothetical protein